MHMQNKSRTMEVQWSVESYYVLEMKWTQSQGKVVYRETMKEFTAQHSGEIFMEGLKWPNKNKSNKESEIQ